MKRLLAIALACLAQAGVTSAQAQTTWQVTTEKGLALVIRDVKAGRFDLVGAKTEVIGKDSRGAAVTKLVGGETKFVESAMSVTLQPGAAFGHRFMMADIPAGDRLVLAMRTVAPRMFKSPSGPSHNIDSTRTWTSQDSGKPQTWFWRFGDAKDKTLLGVWVRKISQGGKPLGEATFTVVP
jgi:hypothetical protein